MSDELLDPEELQAIYDKIDAWSLAHQKHYNEDSESPSHPLMSDAERQNLSREFSELIENGIVTIKKRLSPLAGTLEQKQVDYNKAIKDLADYVNTTLEEP